MLSMNVSDSTATDFHLVARGLGRSPLAKLKRRNILATSSWRFIVNVADAASKECKNATYHFVITHLAAHTLKD